MGSTYQVHSRHAINRLAALHLVCGVLDAFAAPVYSAMGEQERGKAAILASRIMMSVRRAKNMDNHDIENRRLVNTIMRRNEVMYRSFCPEVDAREVMAMAVDIVTGEYESVPRIPKYLDMRLEWGELTTLLVEFYELLDKDLTACAELDKGCLVSDTMRRIY